MTTNIHWWIPVAFLAAGLAGGVFRLGLVRSWMGLSGAILLAVPAFFAGWQELGWSLEGALLAAVGAPLLGAAVPEILRDTAQGVGRLLRWLAPFILLLVFIGFAYGTFGEDRVHHALTWALMNLGLPIVLGTMAIRAVFRTKRSSKKR